MGNIYEEVRRNFGEADTKRDAGLTTPDTVERYDDLQYGPDEAWQVLDVYRPAYRAGEKLPVLVSVHGGGWVYGDKERYQYYCMNLAERGFAVVNFTYRLAPEFKFPAPLIDANLVFHWVLAHAEEYGFDTRYVFAVGDSAGAQLLGEYVNLCTNPEYAAHFDFAAPEGFTPTAVALNCGRYSNQVVDRNRSMTTELMKCYLPNGGTPEEYAILDVSEHVTPAYCPTFVMTSTGDFLKEQALPFAQTLFQNNVECVCRLYGTETDKQGHVFHCDVRSAWAKKCNDEECDFFRKLMVK